MFRKKYVLVFWHNKSHLYQVSKLSDIAKYEIQTFGQNSLLRWPYGTKRVYPCDEKPIVGERLHGKYSVMFIPSYIDGTIEKIKGWENYYNE